MESAGFGLPPGYQRISADFLATTGRTLTLVDADHGGTRGFVELSVEGKPLGGFEFWWSDEADPEFAIADLAEELQEHSLHEVIWGGWPTCPFHGTHPLETWLVGDKAIWGCPTEDRVVAVVGELGAGA